MLAHPEAVAGETAAFILQGETEMLVDTVLSVLARYQLPIGAVTALQDAITAEVFGSTTAAQAPTTTAPTGRAQADA